MTITDLKLHMIIRVSVYSGSGEDPSPIVVSWRTSCLRDRNRVSNVARKTGLLYPYCSLPPHHIRRLEFRATRDGVKVRERCFLSGLTPKEISPTIYFSPRLNSSQSPCFIEIYRGYGREY